MVSSENPYMEAGMDDTEENKESGKSSESRESRETSNSGDNNNSLFHYSSSNSKRHCGDCDSERSEVVKHRTTRGFQRIEVYETRNLHPSG